MPIKRPLRRRRKPTTPRWWTGRRLTAYGKQAISVLVLVGTLFLREQQQPTVPVAKREEDAPPPLVWTVDTNAGGPAISGGRSYPMPPQPQPEQKRPPCIPRTEREVNGGCWTPHAEKPPCPYGTVEHGGSCYQPVAAANRPPTSIEP